MNMKMKVFSDKQKLKEFITSRQTYTTKQHQRKPFRLKESDPSCEYRSVERQRQRAREVWEGGTKDKREGGMNEEANSKVQGPKPTISLITLNVNGLNIPVENRAYQTGEENQDSTVCFCQETQVKC